MREYPFEFAQQVDRLATALDAPNSPWTREGASDTPADVLKRYALAGDDTLEVPSDSIYLHGAATAMGGRAILFLGHSTAGKSTLSRLLATHFTSIADDTVYVTRKGASNWFVRDGRSRSGVALGPPANEATQNRGRENVWPLGAIVRIFKAEDLLLERIGQKRLCQHLMDAVYEVDVQRRFSGIRAAETWFRLAAELARQFPGWHLHFSPTVDTVRLLTERFGAEGM